MPTDEREVTEDPNTQGWALIAVLWVLSMLAMMAAAVQTLAVTSYKMHKLAIERVEINSCLDAAIARAVVGITDLRNVKRWRVDGIPQRFLFDGMSLSVSVQDETGRIDLNVGDGSIIRQLMQSSGLNADEADTLTDRILDWRSASDLRRLHGANNTDYRAAGFSYTPRHGPFQTVEELQLVMGMTPAIFRRVRPALTVYSRSPMIDPNVAPVEALRAFYFNDEERVSSILEQRTDAAELESVANPVGSLDPAISPAGRTFEISISATRGRTHFKRVAVVLVTSDENHPYLLRAWN